MIFLILGLIIWYSYKNINNVSLEVPLFKWNFKIKGFQKGILPKQIHLKQGTLQS